MNTSLLLASVVYSSFKSSSTGHHPQINLARMLRPPLTPSVSVQEEERGRRHGRKKSGFELMTRKIA
jgi:hypothetical protein